MYVRCEGRSKKRRDDGTDDGTLSRPRICYMARSPLYGPLHGDEKAYYMLYGYVTVYLVVDKPQLYKLKM